MNRKYRITTALLALVVAVSLTALVAPVAAQSATIQPTLQDTNGDDLDDRVEVQVDVSNVGGGQTTVELGEGNFDVDVSPTDTADGNQAQFVTAQDTDGDGTNEAVQFTDVGTVNSATYTVVADLSNQADGDTGSVDVSYAGSSATDSASYTVQDTSGGGGPGPSPGLGPGDFGEQRQGSPFDATGIDEVFQGEDIEFTESLVGVENGGAEGEQIGAGEAIPADQATGQYEGQTSGGQVLVRQPRVTEVELINPNGNDVTEANENTPLLIGFNYNYEDAEPVSLEVLDDAGVDVYNDVNSRATFTDLTSAQQAEVSQYDARAAVQFDTAGNYELSVSADGDGTIEDVSSASMSEAVSIVSEDEVSIELDQSSAFQGEDVDYEVTQGEDGDTYYVAIEDDEARDEEDPDERVFRNVEDTENTGITNGHFYAELEIDGATALGRIDTAYLDDTSVDVELYGSQSEIGNELETIDDTTLEVQQSEIGIDSPGRTYVPGQEVDLNGTVSDGLDEVAIFVRDRDEWYHVTNVSVDSEDSAYDEEDFQLGGDNADTQTRDARDILGQPGVYRYGVIDISDVLKVTNDPGSDSPNPFAPSDATPQGGLDSSDFASGASTQQSLRVAEPSLEAEFSTFNGQVYRPDGMDVTGTLIGPRPFAVQFTDSRGNTVLTTDTADREDGEIDEEGLDIDDLRTGNVQAAVISPGRDGVFGDGTFTVNNRLAQQIVSTNTNTDFHPDDQNQSVQTSVTANLDNYELIVEALGDLSRTQSQIREVLLSETVEEAGSDDLIAGEQFRLTSDSRTEINDVVPAQYSDNLTDVQDIEVGETMVVRGTTNRNPEDATIVVEGREGPSIAELDTVVTEDWGSDGVWNVSIEVPEEVEPGQYLIQSDDGERISEANVTIVAEGTFAEGERLQDNIGELQNQIEELENQVSQLESERDDLQSEVDTLEQENADLRAQMNESDDDDGDTPENNTTDDGEGQPGFTAVAALIALIAVALLAIRRKEE